MKIEVSKETKDTFFTLGPLNWLLRIFNLSCIYRKRNHLEVSWSLTRNIIYVLLFGFVTFYILLIKIETLDFIRNNVTLIMFTDTTHVSVLIGYFEYIIVLLNVRKYGRDLYLNYYNCFNHVDQILGMIYYDKIRSIILRTVGFCMVIFTVTSIFDYASWINVFGWIFPTLYSLDYFYFFLNMLMVLDGMSHVIQLEYRLKHMKDLLQGYYTKSICDDDNKIWATGTETGDSRLESMKTLSPDRFIEVIEFNRCYLLLLEQANYTNAKFGFRILVYCTNLLVNMINLLNVAIRCGTASMVLPNGDGVCCRLSSISSIIRMLNWAMIALIIVYRCESTYRQSERILESIDLLLVNKNISANLTTTLVNFRNLLITRPIKFHAIHFFTIEYAFLVSLTSTVVTYTIIFLQNLK